MIWGVIALVWISIFEKKYKSQGITLRKCLQGKAILGLFALVVLNATFHLFSLHLIDALINLALMYVLYLRIKRNY